MMTTYKIEQEAVMPQLGRRGRYGLYQPESATGARSAKGVRACAAGGVETMLQEQMLGISGDPVVFADIRDGMTQLFTLSDSGELTHAMRLDANNNLLATSLPPVATIAPGECQAAVCGSFLIIRDGACALHRLQWSDLTQTYRLLASSPGFRDISVNISPMITLDGVIPAVKFKEKIADPRLGIPTTQKNQLIEAVKKSVEELREDMCEASLFSEPLTVRLAARLWDGTLLCLTAPQFVMPTEFCQVRRATLQTVNNGEGVEGTISRQISMLGYRLRVNAAWEDSTDWGDFVQSVEVWVSPLTDWMTDKAPSVGYNSANETINVGFAAPTEKELMRQMVSSQPQLAWKGRASSLDLEIGYSTARKKDAPWANDRVRLWQKAEAVCGHGGFLHLCGPQESTERTWFVGGDLTASQTVEAEILANVNKSGTAVWKRSRGRLIVDDGMILPFVWYGDSFATQLRVRLRYEDGRKYEGIFSLESTPSGEDGAVWYSGERELVQLTQVSDFQKLTVAEEESTQRRGMLYTSRRGNPLVMQSSISEVGGNIRCMAAQQRGGGAFTRQYLYLFTDTGIVAVNHDMAGNLVNCRPIGHEVITAGKFVTTTREGVFAVSETGLLIQLRDAKLDVLTSGLKDCIGLGACQHYDELWVLQPDSPTLVIGYAGAPRSVSISCVERSYERAITHGQELLLVNGSEKVPYLWVVGPCAGALQSGEWVSAPLKVEHGGLTQVLVDLSGECRNVTIELRVLPPWQTHDELALPPAEQGDFLALTSLQGPADHPVPIALMLPRPEVVWGCSFVRLQVCVRGSFEQLRSVSLSVFGN